MGRSSQLNVRLAPEAEAHLIRFCQRTTRRSTDVVRQIIAMFFADGDEEADRRLSAGLWQQKGTDSATLNPLPPDATPEEVAEFVVDGKRPQRVKRRGKAG